MNNIGTPGAVQYQLPTKKRAHGGEEKAEVRAVLVPEKTSFVFMLTRARRKEFQVPQRFSRGERVLKPEKMNAAERHILKSVAQRKVWARYKS